MELSIKLKQEFGVNACFSMFQHVTLSGTRSHHELWKSACLCCRISTSITCVWLHKTDFHCRCFLVDWGSVISQCDFTHLILRLLLIVFLKGMKKTREGGNRNWRISSELFPENTCTVRWRTLKCTAGSRGLPLTVRAAKCHLTCWTQAQMCECGRIIVERTYIKHLKAFTPRRNWGWVTVQKQTYYIRAQS